MVVLAIAVTAASLHTTPTQPMEALSQLDVQAPDHVSVITRDGKVTISVVKDGTSVTLGFPLRQPLDTTPHSPLQPSQSVMVKRQVEGTNQPQAKPVGAPGSTHIRYTGPTPKLMPRQAREIKEMVNDPDIMSRFTSKTKAYEEIGKAYGITGCAVGNTARNIAWRHIEI